MIALLLAAATTGPFSGVSTANLLDTPTLRYEQVWHADAPGIVRVATHAELTAATDGTAQARTGQGFSLAFDVDLAAGTYRLDVVGQAPNRGADSLHFSVNGNRTDAPLYIPTAAPGRNSAGFRVTTPGPRHLELSLREGPGCVLTEARLAKLTVVPPLPPMRPEIAALRPRLLLTPERLGGLKARAGDPRLASVYALPAPLTAKPPPYKPGQRNGGAFRGLGDHALRYRLAPDPAQLAALVAWLEAAADYGDVGVDLDAEYFTEGVALAYDWLYNDLPPALRERLRDRLAAGTEKLFAASLAGKTGGTLSFQQNHYWFAHLALALGAAALVGECPDAETWLAWAWDRYERIALSFGPDGSFHEGPSYWDFSMPTLYLYTDLYESLTGQRAPALDGGLRGQAEFRFRHLLPGLTTSAPLEDSKVGLGRPAAATLYWEATRFRDSVVQALPAALGAKATGSKLALLWYDPDLTAAAAALERLAPGRLYADVGTVLARTSWDADATFAAFVCRPLGGHSYADLCARYNLGGTGHNHPGQGHFLLSAGGVILAGDTGYTYAKTTRDHNTILIDGKGQYGDGEMWPAPKPGRPRITAFATEGDVTIVSAQVAAAYPPELGLQRFERTFVLAGKELAVVCDRVQAEEPRTFTWLLHHWGTVAEEGNARVLTVADRRLRIQPLLPAAPAYRDEAYRPQFIHPTRNLTPTDPDVNLLAIDQGPAKTACFLVPLVIGAAGEAPPRAESVSGPEGVGVRLGRTTVLFPSLGGPPGRSADGGEAPAERTVAVVITERQGKEVRIVAREER